MKKVKYVFLDVDGVLNNWSAFMLNKKTIYVLSHENLIVYDKFIKTLEEKGFEVRVVLSSTWKKDTTAIKKLTQLGKKYKGLNFYAKTSPYYTDYRCKEIRNYMNAHDISIDDVIVIDDEKMLDEELAKRHIHTDMDYGLRLSHIEDFIDKNISK